MAVAGLALAGCGGGDDEEGSRPRPADGVAKGTPARSGPAPARSEFTEKADAICAEAKRRAAPLADAIGAKVAREDAAGVAAELRKTLPIADRLLRRLRALTPPTGFGTYLADVAAQRRRIPPLVEALEGEDISTIEVLVAELRRGNRRPRRIARRDGLRECDPGSLARPPGAP